MTKANTRAAVQLNILIVINHAIINFLITIEFAISRIKTRRNTSLWHTITV